MKFGELLKTQQLAEWRNEYFQYEVSFDLKTKIKAKINFFSFEIASKAYAYSIQGQSSIAGR